MNNQFEITVDDKHAYDATAALADPKTHSTALYAAGVHFQGLVSRYPQAVAHPSRRSIYGATFKTAKQRRAVMAMIRSGAIVIPYRRGQASSSENMLQRWKTELSADGRTVSVGNTASYAPSVIGLQKNQSLYMRKLGWQSMEEQYKTHGKEVPVIYFKVIHQQIKGA